MINVAAISIPTILGGLALLTGALYRPLALRIKVLGISRSFSPIEKIHGEDLHVISDTWYCEDLHYHQQSNLLFAASEENTVNRWKWFPPMAIFDDPKALGHGSIVVIDPKTFKAKRLTMVDFPGPFTAHGIDVWSPKDDPNSIFIFAVNHLPSPAYADGESNDVPKARSTIEIFHHVAGMSEARHLRSIWHPLIRTPNDILARDSHSFYVTNEHYYREGHMRLFEDIAYQHLAPWTDLVHIEVSDLHTKNDSESVNATVAIKGLHSNNGLARGRHNDEFLIARAAAGVLVLAEPAPYPHLKVTESIQLSSTIDNPSYFADPYVSETGRDASGFVLGGLARAALFPDGKDPVMVWLVQPNAEDDQGGNTKAKERWTQRLIFQDDGTTIRSTSTAVLVAIDPRENNGRKEAWLYVTGPVANAVVASRIDL